METVMTLLPIILTTVMIVSTAAFYKDLSKEIDHHVFCLFFCMLISILITCIIATIIILINESVNSNNIIQILNTIGNAYKEAFETLWSLI